MDPQIAQANPWIAQIHRLRPTVVPPLPQCSVVRPSFSECPTATERSDNERVKTAESRAKRQSLSSSILAGGRVGKSVGASISKHSLG